MLRYSSPVGFLGCVGLVALLSACVDDPESPTAKYEWSILQQEEYSMRSVSITSPEFKTVNGYELLCVPGKTGGRVWIMLKPKATPYYKQMPKTQYSLPDTLVNKLILEQRVSDTVAYVMELHEE